MVAVEVVIVVAAAAVVLAGSAASIRRHDAPKRATAAQGSKYVRNTDIGT